jgi:uncharacterized membrane protein
MTKEKVENEKLVAILSYFLVGMIWYLADEKMKKSEFAKFHFKQALVLLLTSIAWSIIYSILAVITMGLFALVGWIVQILLLVIAIIGIVNAANYKMKPLIIIGGFAKKFKF